MTAPVVTAISFDKTIYTPGGGNKITATVTYTTTNEFLGNELAVTVTDTFTGESGTNVVSGGYSPDGTFNVQVSMGGTADPTNVTATDTGNRTWTLVSNTLTGSSAPFTGTAILTAFA